MAMQRTSEKVYKTGQEYGVELGRHRKDYGIRNVSDAMDALSKKGDTLGLSREDRREFNMGFFNTFDRAREHGVQEKNFIAKSVERAKNWMGLGSIKTEPHEIHKREPKYDTAVLAKSQERTHQDNKLNPYMVRPGDVRPQTAEQSKAYERRLEVEGKAQAAKQAKLANDIAAMPQHNGMIRDSTTGAGVTPREHDRAMKRLEMENRNRTM
jgi:hypothetical protein